MSRTSWERHLSVDRRIVRLLSASTYEDFPGAIREMVSNAYDADATKVDVEIDLKSDTIKVTDDGNGMTPDEFGFFLRIAGRQHGRRISPEFGRQRIGQFGIGFLAIFPFGKRIQVSSTARRSDVWFEATISAEKFFQEGQKPVDVGDIPIPGYEVSDPKYQDQHGTTIVISNLSEMTERYFKPRNINIKKSRQTILSWSPMDRLIWTLTENLPLGYPEESPYKEAFADLGQAGIRVSLNGKPLFRNAPGSDILENDMWEHGGIKCRYVIATDWKSIRPDEARYLKQRLRNVGIGDRTGFGLLVGRGYSRSRWLTGEVRILEGFDDLLSINRNSFRDSEEYDQLCEYFRLRLAHFANYLEAVDETKRHISAQISKSRGAEVGSTREVIRRNVDKLVARGFEVKTIPQSQSSSKHQPVHVDTKRKVVEIVEEHPALADTISIDSQSISVRYTKRDANTVDLPAVRRAVDGTIEINTNYPLFKSRRYGEVFKKVMVVMFIGSEKTKSSQELFSMVTKQLQREFQDLIE